MENSFALIVAGSKNLNINDLTKSIELEQKVDDAIDAVTRGLNGKRLIIIEGGSKGADLYAKYYAEDHNADLVEIVADWGDVDGLSSDKIKYNDRGEAYNPRAGYERNIKIMDTAANYKSKGFLYIWDGTETDFTIYTKLSKPRNIPLIMYDYINDKWYQEDEAYNLSKPKTPKKDIWTLPVPGQT